MGKFKGICAEIAHTGFHTENLKSPVNSFFSVEGSDFGFCSAIGVCGMILVNYLNLFT